MRRDGLLFLHFSNQFLICIPSDSKANDILRLLTRRVMRVAGRQCSENARPNKQTKVTFRNRTKSSPISVQKLPGLIKSKRSQELLDQFSFANKCDSPLDRWRPNS